MKVIQTSVAVIFLCGIFQTAVNTPTTTCAPYNGNEASCKSAQCHWCPCTHMCVTKPMKYTCDVGCIGFCGQTEQCASHGCIYDSSRGQCYDLAIDTTVDFKTICSSGSCDKNACAAKGCHFCQATRACLPPNMSQGCTPGCTTFCNNPDECLARRCIFDYETGECRPNINKRYGHSVNICGNNSITVSGIWYSKTDYTKIRYLSDINYNHCFCNSGIVSGLVDKELYECYMASPEMEIDIPIRESGSYIFGMQFAEIYAHIGRKQTVRLNGIVVLKEFSFDSVGRPGTPFVAMVKFEVNCDLTEATIGGTKVSMKDRNLVMYLKADGRFPGDRIHAAINAYFLEKTDTD